MLLGLQAGCMAHTFPLIRGQPIPAEAKWCALEVVQVRLLAPASCLLPFTLLAPMCFACPRTLALGGIPAAQPLVISEAKGHARRDLSH